MPEGYFHGIKTDLIDSGTRPIKTQSDETIFMVCTADGALDAKVPVGETVMIFGENDTDMIAAIGSDGDAATHLNGIFDQVNCRVMFHRIAEGADAAETLANVIGGIDADTEKRTGLQAAFDAKQKYKLAPSVIVAPGYSQELGVATEMDSIAKKLEATFVVDSPNGTIAETLAYRGNFDAKHGYMVHPDATALENGVDVAAPASPRVAGIIAATPWWESISNRVMYGITGTSRDIDYLGDGTSRAELLNQNGIGTIVRHPKGGWKLLGGRSMSADPKYAFFKRARVLNVIGRTLKDQMQWAVDKNITRRFFEAVSEGVNKWMRHETELEHLAGGRCWVEAELNTPEQQEAGSSYFDVDFTEYGEAEQVTFRLHFNNGYLADVTPV